MPTMHFLLNFYTFTQSKMTEMPFRREEIYSVERDRTETMLNGDGDD